MMCALDFILGLLLGSIAASLAAMALSSYREYQRETAAEIQNLKRSLSDTQAMVRRSEMEVRRSGSDHEN